MSKESLEIVKTVHPPSGTDLTQMYAEDVDPIPLIEAQEEFFDPDLEFEVHGVVPGDASTGRGLEALFQAWREWLQPFESWRTEVEEFVDVDDERVLVLIRDHPRPRGSDAEIESVGCGIWTLREGKVARIDFFPNRNQGLEAAGLAPRN